MRIEDIELPELGLRIGGRGKAAFSAYVAGDLSPEQLRRLDEPRGAKAPALKKLRERHHALARMLADGMAEGTAAIACGFTSSRVSILKGDPAFSELVEHYATLRTERYFDGIQAMAELHMDAVEEIRERLEEQPDEFTIGQLLEVAKFSADRTGMGPSTKTEVDVKIGLADRMQRAYERLQNARVDNAKLVGES